MADPRAFAFPAQRRAPRSALRRCGLAAAALVPLACALGPRPTYPTPESGTPAALVDLPAGERLARGSELYARHCEVCHGQSGDGRGPGAAFLFPPATDWTRGRFRLASTENGAPTDADLVATLRRGMPGSAMPAWGWISEPDLWSLAAWVRELATRGLAARVEQDALDHGEELSPEGARARAEARLAPGPRVRTPPWREPTADDLALGRRLFLESCAPCHGEEGTGSREPRFDEDGGLNWARDFTAGILKGGASREELVHRVAVGMPGSAMPPTPLDDAALAALVAHVRRMIPAGAEDRLVQTRETLRVRRTSALPEAPGDPGWDEAEEIRVVLAPLAWSDLAVGAAELAALHDGQRIALRVRWDDATTDVALFAGAQHADAVALQFSEAPAPALFGMGSAEHATVIWHWRSLRLAEVAEAADLASPVPHLLTHDPREVAWTDASPYRVAEGVPPLSQAVDRLRARGVERVLRTRPEPAETRVAPRATDAGWEVVFVRDLVPASGGDVAFAPGRPVQVALAVWNGAAGDRGARKAISIWQELLLE